MAQPALSRSKINTKALQLAQECQEVCLRRLPLPPSRTGLRAHRRDIREGTRTIALFAWEIEAADVSRLAGHASIRITLDMYIGTTAGTLDRVIWR